MEQKSKSNIILTQLSPLMPAGNVSEMLALPWV